MLSEPQALDRVNEAVDWHHGGRILVGRHAGDINKQLMQENE